MPSSPHQSGNDSGLGPSRRNRRSTSDISSVAKEGRKWSFATAFTNSKKQSNLDANTFPGSSPAFVDPVVANNLRQLHKYTSKIKSAAKNINHVDSAWDDYVKHRERCLECCKSLITPPQPRRESSVASPTTLTPPKSEYQRDLSFDTLNLVAIETGSSSQSSGSRADSSLRLSPNSDQCQKAAREWQSTVELLANTLRTSLQETYNAYDKDATPEGFERLCTDKAARHNTIYHMRNASISKMMSADLDFFPRYDVRFRNYDEIKKDLVKVQSLLGTSGIPQSRTIIERRISPTGDVMLEFANLESEDHPVFRFRVASHCLRETSSPIFGHMFNAHFRAELDDDIRRSLPLPPSSHVCADGNEVMLYRMPQTELNTQRSLEILLHAAHNHTDRVPREVPFSQFVAIAEACLRYRCTSPLELAVEHLWLPYWRDNATDDMLGEVLLISYVFGLPENFTRLSRIAILGMTGPCPSWPQRVDEKIAAVRRAKMEQVYEQCRITLNEYLCPTPPTNPTSSTDGGSSHASKPSALRCPRGDRTCDAQNLGWYMKTLAELGLLPAVLQSPAFSHHIQAPPPQGLLETVDALCLVTSPPQCHGGGGGGGGGVCDFAPAFRAAVKDIYESVEGLTLHDVSGKRGWALSKNRSPRHSGAQNQNQNQNQNSAAHGGGVGELLFKIAEQRYAPGDGNRRLLSRGSAAFRGDGGNGGNGDRSGDDDVCFFKILSLLENPRDLCAAAMVNKRFYRSYLRNKTRLWEGIRGGIGAGMTPGENIFEAEGTPYRGVVDANSGVVLDDHVRSREKFRHGQLLVVEGKSLLETDVNKYPGDIRGRFVGLRIAENRGSHSMR
ncbi:hypothetical protein F5Y12DRAFT_792456 [Xylaria sp. FL1777]|nr:hypothetical protein F5Y12DRAFT_792456 [Xylaria sp. FL1777]